MARAARNLPPSADLWELTIARNAARISYLTSRDDSPPPLPEDEPVTSKLFEFIKERNCVVESTNFTERELVAFYQDAQPHFNQLRTRGANPKIDNLDSIILLLNWLKTGANLAAIAANSGYGENAIRSAIARAKDALLAYLTEKWWSNRQRPVPLEATSHPFIALICDSTSTQVLRPVGRFEEAKIYWDGKNKIYALKKEVAVMASPPHFALFTGVAFVGSEHDYSAFKKTHEKYLGYLRKTPEERAQLPRDLAADSWAILCDSGYTGDSQDTPGLRKMALKKPSQMQFPTQRRDQQELAKIRVPIECFFGRVQKLWAILRGTYRFGHVQTENSLSVPQVGP